MVAPTTSRLQLALNVDDLEEAVAFYTRLFGTEPAKTRPGYANFAIADPPLKLVLFEGVGQGGTINHLGVEVADAAAVHDAATRLGERLVTEQPGEDTCCYARQEKFWVQDVPDGLRWEVYTVLEDTTGFAGPVTEAVQAEADQAVASGCCA
ncbi:MAG: ArsI/CadI family heavy metal resistance metalloenzyme [Nocardioides sp.]